MPKLKRIADKPWNAFASFTAGQKAVTLVAVLVLLLGGVFFSRLTGGTQMQPLFYNLSQKNAAAIVAQLDSSKVSYQLQGTTILVPAGQVDALRLQMAGAGLADSNSESGYSILSKMPVTSSQMQQNMAVKQATEGELVTTLETIEGVESANVHVQVPQQDVFSDNSSKSTAAVTLTLSAGTRLTSSQVNAVTHLVAASVQGLSPDDVTVTDTATGRLLTSGSGAEGSSGSDRMEQTAAYEDDLTSRIETMLDTLVGPGGAVVRVKADLDYDSTKTTSSAYVQPSPSALPISSSTDVENYGNGTGAVSGVLGPDNIGVPTPSPSGTPGSGYSHWKRTQDNALGTVSTVQVKAPGDVRKLTIAVALDKSKAEGSTPGDVEALVTQAAGLDAQRGDAIKVTAVGFDTSLSAAAKADLAKQQALASKGAMMRYAKTGALALLLLMTLLLTWLKSRKARKRMPVSRAELARIDELERRNAELEAEKSQLALTAASNQLALTAAPEPDDDGEGLAKVRTEIGELVDSQPDEVAQLLRGWLADRRT